MPLSLSLLLVSVVALRYLVYVFCRLLCGMPSFHCVPSSFSFSFSFHFYSDYYNNFLSIWYTTLHYSSSNTMYDTFLRCLLCRLFHILCILCILPLFTSLPCLETTTTPTTTSSTKVISRFVAQQLGAIAIVL